MFAVQFLSTKNRGKKMRICALLPLLLGCAMAIVSTDALAQSSVLYLGPAPKPMTVQDVITLSKSGLSDDLIIEQIRKTHQRFNLSTDQLLQLKAASVSEHVIRVMIDPTIKPASVAVAERPSPATVSPQPLVVMPAPKPDDPHNTMPNEIGATPRADKMRIFVQGNNATALELRRAMQKEMGYDAKHPNRKYNFCMTLVNNPKDADAVFAIDSAVNGRTRYEANYTSSAELTATDGTLLWSDSVGDGSKFMDVFAGGTPGVSASRLLMNATKVVCKRDHQK